MHKLPASENKTFRWWFRHWLAYQKTAIRLGIWHFRFLLHDIEKPWMYLIFSESYVKEYHRSHRPHHIEYYLEHKTADWEGMVVDWECSRLYKKGNQRTAAEMMELYVQVYPNLAIPLHSNIRPILQKCHIDI